MLSTTIVFDRKGKAGKNGEGLLEVRLTHNRKSYYFSTGIKVYRTQWLHDAIVNHPASDELNERLGIIMKSVIAESNKYIRDARAIDASAIRTAIWSSDRSGENALLDWIKEQTQLLDVAYGTRKRYKTLIHRLEEYGKFQSWNDLSIQGIYDFDTWLHNRRKPISKAHEATKQQPKAIGDAAVYNYHRCFRYMLSRAVRFGLIDENPYTKMRGELKRGENESTEYLTEDEMAAIESLHPVPGTQLAMARDLFVFQMYTGLSYSDTQAFDIKNYKRIGGKWRIIAERIKTGVPYVNQLLPPAVDVLERYDMQTPKILNVKYNAALKTLGAAVGITTPLHSHLARHTFATWALRNGVKIENLSKMLGHTTIKQTQRYAKVLAQSVHEDFEMMEKVIKERAKK